MINRIRVTLTGMQSIILILLHLGIITLCTINGANTFTSNPETVEIPEFSVKHGFFYLNNFDINLSVKTPNASIRYTLDGSDPRTSTTALIQNSPAILRIDPQSTEGQRGKTMGVVLRACTVDAASRLSETITQTYIFLNKIGSLSPDGQKPGPGWPNPTNSSRPQAIDYGMDPDILKDSRYENLIDNSLLAIPTFSIVTDLKNLFSTDTGIYMNANQDGEAWERPASIELINPDGSDGFQINAGIRIRGGASRVGSNRKHAFRLFFRSKYGPGKLKYPLFENEGVDEFDKMDLRTSQNYSWSFPDHQGEYNTMNRDVFSRDLQREMAQPYTRSRYYHLYLNGVYWGLYQTQERPEARFAASYFGGQVEDYDVVKISDASTLEATDGNLNAFRQVWDLCNLGFKTSENYFKLQGLNEDGTPNPIYPVLVDIDNLIDYMLVIFYTGNFDGPTCKFYQNKTPRNFYCIYNRNRREGFKFFVHDAEHTLRTTAGEGPGIGLNENRVNIGTLSSNDPFKMSVTDFSGFHPQWLHYRLSDNPEYRVRFMDHVYKHFFNQGCMTPENATAIFLSRAQEIELAIIAESARWGDTYHHPPRNKNDDWQKAVDDIVNNYFPYRTGIVLNQLKSANLYPDINPPVFKNNKQQISKRVLTVDPGFLLTIQKPDNMNGNILYTLDGQDPRAIGGMASSSAKDGGAKIEMTVHTTTVIKTRLLNGTTWSALNEITLFADNNTRMIRITEIHYHPLDGDNISDNDFEFLEMKNCGNTPVSLSEAIFVEGIRYTFPAGTIIAPNQFIVLASKSEEFNHRYGFFPFDRYSGQLDNGGERLTLLSAIGDTIFSIAYDDKFPWPETPDGGGFSLVAHASNPAAELNNPENWRASYFIHGSPGKDDLPLSLIETLTGLSSQFALYQNYPNPFNPQTTITFSLAQRSSVTLNVYDVLGKKVATLIDNEKRAGGNHEISFNATNLPAGIYFYRLESENFTMSKKMLLMK